MKSTSRKIGILTFHDTTNFGAVLQAVATYIVVRDLGFWVEIIDYHCKEIDCREIPEYQIKAHKKSMMFWIKFILRDYKNIRKHRDILAFLKDNAQISLKSYTRKNIKDIVNQYDMFLIGSDMLWCTEFTGSDYTFMLDFLQDCNKKSAFATSIGIPWAIDEEAVIVKYLEDFKNIAVREPDSAEKLSLLLKRKINYVCDPTMLIKPEQWRNFIGSHSKQMQKYCLVYMDDWQGNCIKNAKDYAKQYAIGLKVIGFKVMGKPTSGFQVWEVYSVEDFLASIADAEMLFTASYHGMLFAIYFHIPFVYFNKDSSRLEGIANILGLENRNGNRYRVEEMREIYWPQVDRKREKFRIRSMEMLKLMLHAE